MNTQDEIISPSETRRLDPDIAALKACCKALDQSTSRRMLKANLEFLLDHYLVHPSPELPEHLRPNNGNQQTAGPAASLQPESKPGRLLQ